MNRLQHRALDSFDALELLRDDPSEVHELYNQSDDNDYSLTNLRLLGSELEMIPEMDSAQNNALVSLVTTSDDAEEEPQQVETEPRKKKTKKAIN